MGRRQLRPLQFLWRRVAVVLTLPVIVPAALLLAANTHVGHQLIGSAVERLSSGRVRLEGLGGVLPHRPLVTLLELRDDEGTWLRVEDAALDLEPLALLRGEIVVDSLRGRSVRLIRRPAGPEPVSEPILPPWPMRLDRLRVDRLALDALVPGAPELALDGNAVADGDGRVRATVEAGAIGRADRYRLDLSSDAAEHRFDLEVLESSGGLLTGLAAQHGWHSPPALGPEIRLVASGRLAGDAWHVDSARIDTTGGTLQAQGSVAADALALGWTLDLQDIGVLLPGALGAVRVGGEVAGPPGAPRVVATLASTGGLTLPGAVRVADVAVDARLSDLLGAVDIDASATLTGLAVAGVAGDLALTARGQLAAMALTAETNLQAGGDPLRIGLAGRLDAFGRVLALERLEATGSGRGPAPARAGGARPVRGRRGRPAAPRAPAGRDRDQRAAGARARARCHRHRHARGSAAARRARSGAVRHPRR